MGDVDIDYRSRNPLSGEGHTKHYNSDIRALGPEKADGKPINNYERFVATWPNLRQWWAQREIKNSTYEK